jgi:hypothetical protein
MSKSRVAVGRKIEDELEARRCLLAASRGRLSAGEWARAHGIDGRSLHAWQMNLERRGTMAPRRRRKARTAMATRALVELVPATPSVTITGRGRYVLEVAGARVEFDDDASVATLRRVLEALRSC